VRIEIPKLSAEGEHLEGEEPKEVLELEEDRFMRPSGPLRYALFVQVATHQLVVKGRVGVEMDLMCSRCAEFFSTTAVDSSFLRAYELKAGTEVVDITGDFREAVLLNMASYPVCSPDCRGLCPQCGRNLNKGSCSCHAPERSSPWDGLDQLDL